MLDHLPLAHALRSAINRANQQKVPTSVFLTDDLYNELIKVYRDDILILSDLVGRDFTPWLRRESLEPLL